MKQQSKVGSPGGSGAVTNPFLSSPPSSQANIVDLFGAAPSQGGGTNDLGGQNAGAHSKASDDLLQLGNPFADMFGGAAPAPAAQPGQPANNMWMGNGNVFIHLYL